MAGTNDGVAFSMTHLFPRFNVQGPLADRATVGDLSSPVLATCIALLLLLLTVQVLPKRPPLSFVGINTQVNRLMADRQFARNLFRAPLQLQQQLRLVIHPCWHRIGVATVLRSIGRHLASLLGPITQRASVTAQLPTDGGLASVQHLGYLRLIVSGFHEGVNLISFSLAEVFVGHKQLRLPGQEALNAKHPQPPNHQLIKVALLA